MQNKVSQKRNLREAVYKYFKNGVPIKKYREIAAEVGCTIGMINYYKNPTEACIKIRERSGRDEWNKVWNFIYRDRGDYEEVEETFNTPLRKKGRSFLYGVKKLKEGETYMSNKNKLLHKGVKIKDCLDQVWPHIQVNEKVSKQSVHPWTKQLDFYDDGRPIMSPWTRSTITGDIINAKSNLVEVDHKDGNRLNNHPSNFSFTERYANGMKNQLSYLELINKVEKIAEFLKRYVK